MMLLAILTDTVHSLTDTSKHLPQVATQDDLRFGDLLVKGGGVMVPIGLLFVLALVIFFERYFTIRKAAKDESNLMSQVRTSILTGKLDSAIAISRSSNSALGRMLQKGLLRIGRPIKEIEEYYHFRYHSWYCTHVWLPRYHLWCDQDFL